MPRGPRELQPRSMVTDDEDVDLTFLSEDADPIAEADAWRRFESVRVNQEVLLSSVRQYLALLSDVKSHPRAYQCLYGDKDALKSSLYRYARIWLPLYAKQFDDAASMLVPPLDVAWIWCCHRLCPLEYERDMLMAYGKVLDPAVQDPICFDTAECTEASRKLWNELSPNQHYDDFPECTDNSPNHQENLPSESGFTCDLEDAISSQQHFLEQSDRSWVGCREYIMGSVTRYRLFLNLLASNPGVFLVPTFDIDVIWHSHLMCVKIYAEETTALFGHVLDHKISDGSEDSRLKVDRATRLTVKIWNGTYGVPYSRAEAMHKFPPKELSLQQYPESGGQNIGNFGGSDGLNSRLVFWANVTVWGLSNCSSPPKQPVFVQIRALSGSPLLALNTPEKLFSHAKHPPQWNHSWSFLCEKASEGISLQVMAQPALWLRELWGERLLGSASLQWSKVQDQPALFLDTELVLSGYSFFLMDAMNRKSVPRLHLSVSLTPPTIGPCLLRTTFMQSTDDSGAMVCDRMYVRRGLKAQTGRWVSRTVYDHASREVFVVRKRVGTGVWMGDKRPVAVLPRERVIVVHRGGWTYLEEELYGTSGAPVEPPHCRVGWVDGDVIAQAVPQPSHDFATFQNFKLVGGGDQIATLSITCDMEASDWLDSVKLTLEDDNGCPAALLMGRHLGYGVRQGKASEERNFVTLVRFSAKHPRGRATALFNWQCSTMEAAADEQPVLVLLLLVTFCEALRDMRGIFRLKPFRRVSLPFLDPCNQWDSMVPCKCATVDVQPLTAGNKEEGRRQTEEVAPVCCEEDMAHWWNKDKIVKVVGAGSCGAGACGSNSQPAFI